MSQEIYSSHEALHSLPSLRASIKANALVGSSAGGQSLLAKQHDKRKKSFAKGKKARAHSAHVRVNFDDERAAYLTIICLLHLWMSLASTVLF